jgi:methylenetetrahydrofolate reductase (NADPH)
MLFQEYYKRGENKPVISFEIFHPKTDAGFKNLKSTLSELVGLEPDFITVTYGAMGTTRDRTLEIAALIKNELGVESACHLTCVGASRNELDGTLRRIYDAGIRNIVAIRGDPPGGGEFLQPENGFKYGSDLVRHIREFEAREFGGKTFGIAVGGYPETHPEAPGPDEDLANLKKKVEAGADVVITQLFFDNALYFGFEERALAAGIETPVIPGLMPILSSKQIERITSMCGASIPPRLRAELDRCRADDDAARRVGIDLCISQAKGLLERGVRGIHFYVLNKSDHVKEIMEALPLRRDSGYENRLDTGNPGIRL